MEPNRRIKLLLAVVIVPSLAALLFWIGLIIIFTTIGV